MENQPKIVREIKNCPACDNPSFHVFHGQSGNEGECLNCGAILVTRSNGVERLYKPRLS